MALCEGAAALSGDCPAASQIGRIVAAAGPGPAPLWIPQPGKEPTAIYLAGPYKGAPYSVVANVPAQAGPFDLGDVVTRATLNIDPETARARGLRPAAAPPRRHPAAPCGRLTSSSIARTSC